MWHRFSTGGLLTCATAAREAPSQGAKKELYMQMFIQAVVAIIVFMLLGQWVASMPTAEELADQQTAFVLVRE